MGGPGQATGDQHSFQIHSANPRFHRKTNCRGRYGRYKTETITGKSYACVSYDVRLLENGVNQMAEAELLEKYGCGPIQFSGSPNASYQRHLVFDNVIALQAAGPRERFEALARSVRDVLSQRWVRTEEQYTQRNPKRIYYLSMEYLIGRSLANNITNLLLDPIARQAAKQEHVDPVEMLEQEPDAGLGNGGLGRLAACFLDSMATMALPGDGLWAAL